MGQKERLKGLKANLDVLRCRPHPSTHAVHEPAWACATFRRWHAARGRKPIQTVLQPYDPMVVREAILHELERGGKVFYIHDRIGSIGLRARTLNQLARARIGVAHGR